MHRPVTSSPEVVAQAVPACRFNSARGLFQLLLEASQVPHVFMPVGVSSPVVLSLCALPRNLDGINQRDKSRFYRLVSHSHSPAFFDKAGTQ